MFILSLTTIVGENGSGTFFVVTHLYFQVLNPKTNFPHIPLRQ